MESKVCTRCCTEKDKTEFFKTRRSKDGLQPACKSCMNLSYKASRGKKKEHYNKVAKARMRRTVDFVAAFKENATCMFCSEDDASCLDFHHTDPTTKDGDVSDMMYFMSQSSIKREMDKCVVLCSNCHRKLHAGKIALL